MRTIVKASDPAFVSYLPDKWARPIGPKPWRVRAFVKQRAWVDANTPKLGFVTLRSIEVTRYLGQGKLASFVEELEDYVDVGVIKPSQMSQQLSETRYGDLLSTIKATTVGGKTVHLWELELWIGWGEKPNLNVIYNIYDGDPEDEDTDLANWERLDPSPKIILAWLTEPLEGDNPQIPRWQGNSRKGVVKFTMTGYSLLYWLGDISSSFLGDCSNYSGRYVEGGEQKMYDETIANRLCNYATLPQIVNMLNRGGVRTEDITFSIKPDLGNEDFSTLDHLELGTNQPLNYIPTPFFWKSVGYQNYFIWFDGSQVASGSIKIIVSMIDFSNCNFSRQEISVTMASSGYLRKVWHSGNANDGVFYCLTQDTLGAYLLRRITLSGTLPSVAASLVTYAALATPVPNFNVHWSQMDLDQSSGRLYACCSSTGSGFGGGMSLGYWTLSTGAWTAVISQMLNYFQAISANYEGCSWYTPQSEVIGGFKVVTDTINIVHGFAGLCMVYFDPGSPANRWKLQAWFYDDRSDEFATAPYEYGLYTSPTDTRHWAYDTAAKQTLINGRGTIGGHINLSNGNYYFYFSSWLSANDSGRGRTGKAWYWSPGNLSGIVSVNLSPNPSGLDDIDKECVWRSFASQGSSAIEYTVGICQYDYSATSDYPYACCITPMICRKGSGDNPIFLQGIDGFLGDSYTFGGQFPIVSAPSLSSPIGYGNYTYRGRVFTLSKLFKDSQENDRSVVYLTVLAEEWIPNFAKDFTSGNDSIYQELKDISKAYNLLIDIRHEGCVLKDRSCFEDTPVGSITQSGYVWNGISIDYINGYDAVRLTPATGAEVISGSASSSNAKRVDSLYVLQRRAQKRADTLFLYWQYNHDLYEFEGRNLPMFRPGDKVYFDEPIPPGGRGYYHNSTGVIVRTEMNGMKNTLQVLKLTTGTVVN